MDLRGFGRLFDFMKEVHFNGGSHREAPSRLEIRIFDPVDGETAPRVEVRAVEQPSSLPELPLLTHLETLNATDWLVSSLTTFGRTVSSFLPGDLPSYARVYHPFDSNDASGNLFTWREVAATDEYLRDGATAADFASHNPANLRAREGNLHPTVIDVLIEHLRLATTTPERCYFALWNGFADSVVPPGLGPKLELPNRRYDVFFGPVEGARTSLSDISWSHQSANLWWAADHAWCVATEIDLPWTYVGGPRECIASILADPRLEAVETTALAEW